MGRQLLTQIKRYSVNNSVILAKAAFPWEDGPAWGGSWDQTTHLHRAASRGWESFVLFQQFQKMTNNLKRLPVPHHAERFLKGKSMQQRGEIVEHNMRESERDQWQL